MQATKNGGTMSNRELTNIANMLKQAIEKMGNGEEDESPSSWKTQPEKSSSSSFLGVSVPFKVETRQGSLRCYLALPPEIMSSPESFLGAINHLLEMEIPLDFYQPKNNQEVNNHSGGWRDQNNKYRYRNGYNNSGYHNNGGYNR